MSKIMLDCTKCSAKTEVVTPPRTIPCWNCKEPVLINPEDSPTNVIPSHISREYLSAKINEILVKAAMNEEGINRHDLARLVDLALENALHSGFDVHEIWTKKEVIEKLQGQRTLWRNL